jgi:hypothetical protein
MGGSSSMPDFSKFNPLKSLSKVASRAASKEANKEITSQILSEKKPNLVKSGNVNSGATANATAKVNRVNNNNKTIAGGSRKKTKKSKKSRT